MTTETIHTCSYECERPECIRAQRDELAARLTAETSNARGELRVADIREDAREPLQLLREKLAHDEDGWAAICRLMPMLAAAPPPPPPAAEGGHAGDVSAEDVAVLHRIKAALPDIGVNGWYEGVHALERVLARLSQQPEATLLREQPCGCVICVCEDEKQCHGCGARHCGNRTDHPAYVAQQPEARGVADEGSRSVTNQLLHWGGIPVRVTGTVTTSPGNWPLIDATLTEAHDVP